MTRNTEPVPETPIPNPAIPGASAEHADTSTEQVVVRRSPRYLRLIVLGAGVGAVGAFFASVLREPAYGYSQSQVFGFLLVFGIVFGGAFGIIVALLLDRIAGRGQRTVLANKLRVHEENATVAQLPAPAEAAPVTDTVSSDPDRGRAAP